MRATCPRCNAAMKESSQELWGVKDFFRIVFCPKCEYFTSYVPRRRHDSLPFIPLEGLIVAFRGSVSRGVDERTGEFRLSLKGDKITREGAELTWKILPTARETKERAKAYPELKQGDEVIVAGFHTGEKRPLISVMLKNLANGVTSTFVDEQISLKKGFVSSFNIRNPILIEAEKWIEFVITDYESMIRNFGVEKDESVESCRDSSDRG